MAVLRSVTAAVLAVEPAASCGTVVSSVGVSYHFDLPVRFTFSVPAAEAATRGRILAELTAPSHWRDRSARAAIERPAPARGP
jgi:hypothetical protein